MNKRVKHQLEIRLPLAELWKVYTEPNAASMVKNFCIVYIEMAFDRASFKVCASFLLLVLESLCAIGAIPQLNLLPCICRKRKIWDLYL